MTIKIVLDDKSTQVIRVPENFKEKKSPQDMHNCAHTIANDVSRGNYKSVTIGD